MENIGKPKLSDMAATPVKEKKTKAPKLSDIATKKNVQNVAEAPTDIKKVMEDNF